jgi:hypothetical protein
VRELEFLPPEYLRARYQRRVSFIRSWLLLAMGLAMVLWSLQIGAWVREAQAELAALHGTDTAVNADVVKVRLLRAEADTYKRRIELLQALRPQATTTELLAAVSDLLPDGVVVEEMSVDRGSKALPDQTTVRLSGVAPTETIVTQALAALELSPAFNRVVLVESKPAAQASGHGTVAAQAVASGDRAFVLEIVAAVAKATRE